MLGPCIFLAFPSTHCLNTMSRSSSRYSILRLLLAETWTKLIVWGKSEVICPKDGNKKGHERKYLIARCCWMTISYLQSTPQDHWLLGDFKVQKQDVWPQKILITLING